MKQTTLKADGVVLTTKCGLALSFFERFLGLMGRKSLPEDQAILFPNCNSIHTFFMRFPIDVLFLDSSGKIVETLESLPAWRMLLPRRKAKVAVEFAPNRIQALGLKVGQQVEWEK